LFGLIVLAFCGFYVLVLPVLVLTARRRVGDLEKQVSSLKQEVASLDRLLRHRTVVASPPAADVTTAAPFEADPPPLPAGPEPIVGPAPIVPAAAAFEATSPGPTPFEFTPFEPKPFKPAPLESASSEPASSEHISAAPPPIEPAAGGPPPPVPPSPPKYKKPEPAWGDDLRRFNWESLIGVKLFSAIAGVALLLAAVFFLRFSLDHGWLQPPVRVAIGVLVGVALLIVCELRIAGQYRVTANAMDASAIGILFSTFFAAHSLWDLIPASITFFLLVVVTAVAVLLSIRRQSLFIAVLGLLGGFAAPALLSSGQNNPLGLFGYLLLLNAGLAWVARLGRWPLITTLTLVLTTIYQWGWVMKFLSAADLPLAAGIFLVFPLMTMSVAALGNRYLRSRGDDDGGHDDAAAGLRVPGFGESTGLGAVLPLLLATYIAAVPQYGARYGILFGFLLLIDLGLFAISLARRNAALHLVGASTTLVVFAIWLGLSYGEAAWPVVLAIVSVFALLYLLAPAAASWLSRPFDRWGEWSAYAAPLLLAVFPVLVIVEPATATPWLLFGTLALLLLAMAWFALASGASAVYFTATAFAFATEALWSANHLTPGRLYAALVVYVVFAFIYIAMPVAARRFDRDIDPPDAALVPVLGTLLLAFFLTGSGSSVMGSAALGRDMSLPSLLGLAALIALVMIAVTVEGTRAGRAWFAPLAAVLSWFLIGAWWADASVSAKLPGLLVLAGVALLTMGLAAWMFSRVPVEAETDVGPADAHLALGLVGHLLLIGIMRDSRLSIPPWPEFAVLLVLDLALTVAALYVRRAALHTAGLIASVLVLLFWIVGVDAAPWPLIAIGAALALVAYALATLPLAPRAGWAGAGDGGVRMFAIGAVAAAIGGELIAMIATGRTGAPGYGILAATHVVLLVILLGLAVRQGWSRLVYAPLVMTTLAVMQWNGVHADAASWQAQLVFAGAIYACFLAYPIVRGQRAGSDMEPYRVAVLASVPFFFFARHALLQGGFGPVIGGLAVVQAVLMLGLLMRLLRLEPPGERTLGRLALVAGAALAFVTVAIPLQLEKEWLTVGWALEAAAVAWLYRRIPHRGLLLASTALFAVVFVRLALNPQVFVYAPRSSVRIFNWYLYTYFTCAAAFFAAARLLARTDDRLREGWPRISPILPALGTALLFLVLNIEIADYHSTGSTLTFRFSATLAQDLSYTLGWGIFALALLAAGIRGRNRPARMASIALLLATVLKCFLHDLARLGGLYLVGSFVGLAVCLALVALALQRFALAEPKDAES
jgi:uncharacterized membrane protein